MNDRKFPPVAAIAAFLTTAVLSMTMLAAKTAATRAEPMVTRRTFQVEHIKIETTKNFADVEVAFDAGLPKLDPAMVKAMAAGDEQRRKR